MVFNSAWHESTAATPSLLFLGRELNHPLGLRWQFHELDLSADPKGVKEYWETALDSLRKARGRVAARYNVGRREVDFQVGDLVLVRMHTQSSRPLQRSAKLNFRWSEPLIIAIFVSPVTALLANPITGVIVRKAHVCQLKRALSSRDVVSE
jgi:hypothetical protein